MTQSESPPAPPTLAEALDDIHRQARKTLREVASLGLRTQLLVRISDQPTQVGLEISWKDR